MAASTLQVLDATRTLKYVKGDGAASVGDAFVSSVQLDATVNNGATKILKNEDSASADGDAGVMILAMRQATVANTSGTDGDYEPLRMDGGKLHIQGTAKEDAASADGDWMMVAGAKRTDTTPAATSGTNGDYEPLQVFNGKLWVGGNVNEDVASADADTLMAVGAVRQAAPVNSSGTDGDYENLKVANGLLWTKSPSLNIGVTPTVSTSPAYSSGDAIGGIQTLTNAARVSGGETRLTSIVVVDNANQKAAMTILFFSSNPAAATVTDNAAFVYSTDNVKLVGHHAVAAADFVSAGTSAKAIASYGNINKLMLASGSANLFAVLVTTGTPTYGAVTDILCIYGFDQVD